MGSLSAIASRPPTGRGLQHCVGPTISQLCKHPRNSAGAEPVRFYWRLCSFAQQIVTRSDPVLERSRTHLGVRRAAQHTPSLGAETDRWSPAVLPARAAPICRHQNPQHQVPSPCCLTRRGSCGVNGSPRGTRLVQSSQYRVFSAALRLFPQRPPRPFEGFF